MTDPNITILPCIECGAYVPMQLGTFRCMDCGGLEVTSEQLRRLVATMDLRNAAASLCAKDRSAVSGEPGDGAAGGRPKDPHAI